MHTKWICGVSGFEQGRLPVQGRTEFPVAPPSNRRHVRHSIFAYCEIYLPQRDSRFREQQMLSA